jgi:5-methylcytosine-specific restriction endonuclease McrA
MLVLLILVYFFLRLPSTKKYWPQKVREGKEKHRTLTNSDKFRIKKKNGFKCYACRNTFKSRYLQVHHVKPFSRYKTGGAEWYDADYNLRVLCKPCHKEYHEKYPAYNKRL